MTWKRWSRPRDREASRGSCEGKSWPQVLGDEVMAAALIDRLLHHCHIVNLRGNSYRMRAHQNLWRSKERYPLVSALAPEA